MIRESIRQEVTAAKRKRNREKFVARKPARSVRVPDLSHCTLKYIMNDSPKP